MASILAEVFHTHTVGEKANENKRRSPPKHRSKVRRQHLVSAPHTSPSEPASKGIIIMRLKHITGLNDNPICIPFGRGISTFNKDVNAEPRLFNVPHWQTDHRIPFAFECGGSVGIHFTIRNGITAFVQRLTEDCDLSSSLKGVPHPRLKTDQRTVRFPLHNVPFPGDCVMVTAGA